MTPTTQALEWIVDSHLEVARLYRLAIEREIQHVIRIYGNNLRDDVRRALKASVRDIAVPQYPTPDDRETVSLVWHKVPKVNFERIRQEYLEQINSY